MKCTKAIAFAAAICMLGSAYECTAPLLPAVSVSAETKLTYEDLTYEVVDDHIEITSCKATAETADVPAEIDGKPVTVIAATAFFKCKVTSVKLPDTITEIGGGAFWHCLNLESVNIPEGVTSIANHAFADCPLLAEINVPKSVTYIGAGAFDQTAWNDAQKEKNTFVIVNGIVLDASKAVDDLLAEREAAAAEEEAKLKEAGIHLIKTDDEEKPEPFVITFPDGITEIGETVFVDLKRSINVTDIIVPEGVVKLDKEAFNLCHECVNIQLPSTLMEVGDNALDGTLWLDQQEKTDGLFIINDLLIDGREASGSVTIPEQVKTICGYAFNANENVTDIVISEGVETIGEQAFKACKNLTTVKLPDSLKSIGKEAFIECGLTEMTVPKNVEKIGSRAFISCTNLPTINLAADQAEIGAEAFGYNNVFTPTGQYAHIYVLEKLKDFTLNCHADSVGAAYAEANEIAYQTGMAGDVTDDFKVNIADVILLSRYVADDDGIAEIYAANADVNADKKVNADDVAAQLCIIARLPIGSEGGPVEE